MVIRFLVIVSIIFAWSSSLLATHNRAGEITYEYLGNNTYKFTITTCTKTSSEADRDFLTINYGDGQQDTLPRTNIQFLTFDSQKNTYIGQHTYTSGPGSYLVWFHDPNRNIDVNNVVNSVDKYFCVETELVISPFLGGANNSVQFDDCPCPELACAGQQWFYNSLAYDPDGDSLSYELVFCKGEFCVDFSSQIYQFPDDFNAPVNGNFVIDPVTGTITWDGPGPVTVGEYNVAIKVREWRSGVNIGSVIRDMQITVKPCANGPPEIDPIEDTCVVAGTYLSVDVTANEDPTSPGNHYITLTSAGEPFNLNTNPSTFTGGSADLTITGTFEWTPDCEAVRRSDYTINFVAEDNDPNVPLKDIETWNIKVVAPQVTNVTTQPIGTTIQVSWDPHPCSNVAYYKIYRSSDSIAYTDDCCSSTPEDIGYSLVGTVNVGDTFYVDSNNLVIGITYCYVVVTVLTNDEESCMSEQICTELNFEVPIITNVSIDVTDVAAGNDSVVWARPKELDTTNFPGPYHYRLYKTVGHGAANTLIYTGPTNADITILDTVFVDNSINTQDSAHTYAVELYSGQFLVGKSPEASSIFVSTIPNDNELNVTWYVDVPWINDTFYVYRETPTGSGTFNLIGITTDTFYVDTGLINKQTYCYKVMSDGHYNEDGVIDPLLNWSQVACGVPWDYTPPCAPPNPQIDGDCDLEEVYLQWDNPNNTCADDVMSYNLYYTPFTGQPFEYLTSLQGSSNVTFTDGGKGSIAGCYYITAVDSAEYGNESTPSDTICIDNCDGVYELPNVFTPNGDGSNDLYHPIFPYKFVEKVDFQVFNRWGQLVFKTENPNIMWDGRDMENGKLLSEGTYFFVCKIFTIKLAGLIPTEIQGTVDIRNPK
ncbi:MAG: gliding motility-associated C-terminal domain-containing protein [Crocinitomicaceae bacterium]|nr:gliding motility-associated C-terminal domain-containing protein [Crocinitomicaceae bacterium]